MTLLSPRLVRFITSVHPLEQIVDFHVILYNAHLAFSSELEKTNESRDSGDSRGHQGNGEVENRGERGEEEETRDCDRGQTVEEQTSAEVDVETKTGGQSSDSVTHEATVESRDCEKSGTTGGENAELKEGVERREGEGEGGEGERKEGEEEEETRREEKVIVEGETTEDVKEKEVVAKEEEEEEEKPPIPPPRRKRKKKLQKNPSLEDFEVYLDDKLVTHVNDNNHIFRSKTLD